MRLPDFAADTQLNDLRVRMGATRAGDLSLAPPSRRLTDNQAQQLITKGIEVQSLTEVRPLADGTLAYRDRRVFVYDRDLAVAGVSPDADDSFLRFHVANCGKLSALRASSNERRYVVSAQTDFINNRLRVCEECIAELGYDGINHNNSRLSRQFVAHAFTVERFYHLWPRDLREHDSLQAAVSGLLDEFAGDVGEHAMAAKEAAGYRCSKCGVDLSAPEMRKYLHVHHRDGVQQDNLVAALMVLCIACHANQSGHGLMRALADYVEFSQLARR